MVGGELKDVVALVLGLWISSRAEVVLKVWVMVIKYE